MALQDDYSHTDSYTLAEAEALAPGTSAFTLTYDRSSDGAGKVSICPLFLALQHLVQHLSSGLHLTLDKQRGT